MTRTRRTWLYLGIGTGLALALVVALLGPRWLTPAPPTMVETAPASPAPVEARRIRARLFYVNEEGTGLSGVDQEVSYADGPVEQAMRIVEAQLAAPAPPLVSAIPPGTTLRSLFLTTGGDAYLDLSSELLQQHPGGTNNELLTAYSLVSALTSNMPAIKGVQILIDGREADTLAGHVDLRRPLAPDPRWITD